MGADVQQNAPVQRGRGAFSSAVAKQEGDGGPVRDGGQLDDPPPLKGYRPHVNSNLGHCEQICWYSSLIGDFFPSGRD